MKIVCHISYHNAFDDRIYWKELLSLKAAGYKTIHICVSDKNADYITAEGVQVIEIKRNTVFKNLWLNRFYQIVFKNKGILKTILKVAKNKSADIYHLHDLQLTAIAGEIKKFTNNPKLIYDVHEIWWQVIKEQRKKGKTQFLIAQLKSSLYKKWEIKNAVFCDYIITTDQNTLNYFQQFLPSIPKSIVYNYSYFLPGDTENTNEKKYDFIYSGLLAEARGIFEIIKSVSVLTKEYPRLNVLLIGPYENLTLEQRVKDLIVFHNIEKNITLHAPVAFKKISEYYSTSKIGLGLFQRTPKYTTFIPIKLFEYMAFGLPVIFSNFGPAAKIIKEANCGLLLNSLDTDDIYKAMTTLISDDQLYKKYSDNGKMAVVNSYNWLREKEKLLHIYQNILT